MEWRESGSQVRLRKRRLRLSLIRCSFPIHRLAPQRQQTQQTALLSPLTLDARRQAIMSVLSKVLGVREVQRSQVLVVSFSAFSLSLWAYHVLKRTTFSR